MSGGPTVNADGEVVGVISSGFDTTDLSYASPIGRISELLSAAGVEPTTSESTTSFREGVRALHDGDRATAVGALQEVLDEQPRNESAADHLERAEALPEESAPAQDSGINWVVAAIIGGTTLLVGLIAAAATTVARRRSRAADRYRATAAWPPATPTPTPAWAPAPGGQAWAPQHPAQGQPVGFNPGAPTMQLDPNAQVGQPVQPLHPGQPPYGWR